MELLSGTSRTDNPDNSNIYSSEFTYVGCGGHQRQSSTYQRKILACPMMRRLGQQKAQGTMLGVNVEWKELSDAPDVVVE